MNPTKQKAITVKWHGCHFKNLAKKIEIICTQQMRNKTFWGKGDKETFTWPPPVLSVCLFLCSALGTKTHFMSPVSPVFHTEVTVSICLKLVSELIIFTSFVIFNFFSSLFLVFNLLYISLVLLLRFHFSDIIPYVGLGYPQQLPI